MLPVVVAIDVPTDTAVVLIEPNVIWLPLYRLAAEGTVPSG